MMSHDFVLRGGRLVDGTGSAPRQADVAVRQGRISAIGAPGSLEAGQRVDVTGLSVTPGFVDIHSHADYTLLRDGRAHSATLQGVTSIVTGNCGHGIAPLSATSAELAAMNIFGWEREGEVSATWRSFREYMDLLRQRGVAPNVFPLVAHGALRLSVSGFADRGLDSAEIGQMRSLLEAAMAAGAVGLSTGLEYAPGISASTEELVEVAGSLTDFNALYSTHCRNRSDAMDKAAQEAVEIAQAGRCRLQMSHFLRRPHAPDDATATSWDILERARRAGMSVFADVFPFDYGPTPLAVLIPPRFLGGGRAEMAAKLADPAFKRQVLAELGGMFEAAVRNDLVSSMYVAADGAAGDLVGLSLADVAEKNHMNAVEAAYWLLQNAGENFYCVTIVENWVLWNDLVSALEDDRFFIMGDAATGCLDHSHQPMSLSEWGYAPRFLADFVRDGGDRIPIEKAIHRMTLGPARQIGLTDRGSLEVGKAADIVAVNMEKVGSDVSPSSLRHTPAGIEHVWINGVPVVASGAPTPALPGVVGISR